MNIFSRMFGRFLFKKNAGSLDMITMGITAAIMFAIAIPIIFSTIGSLDIASVDATLQTSLGDAGMTPAANATTSLLTQTNSFFSIGPIYLIVIVAVGIIAALLVLRRVSV